MRYITSVLATVALTVGLGSAAPTEAIIIDGCKFGLVGVVFDAGQAVQVNITHIGDPQISPAASALVEFFEGTTGVLLKTTNLKLAAGETQGADLGMNELIPLKGKVPIYAGVTMDDPNLKPACRASLEVLDKTTGRTVAAMDNPELRPSAEAIFRALTLVTGQAVRVNAVNMGDPNEVPCPVVLAILAADGKTTLGQQRALLPAGVGTSLDVAVGDPNERVLLRATARRLVENRIQASLCRAFVFSVEIYDVATGITTLIMGDPEE